MAKNHYENLHRERHLTLFMRITCVARFYRIFTFRLYFGAAFDTQKMNSFENTFYLFLKLIYILNLLQRATPTL